ncbi:MAG: histidine phosphatase family protein [Bacteroidales bacterium]
MKRITIIRHGKSSWANNKIADHERPLLPKGKRRTHEIAEYIKERTNKPDLIISSTATRALQTAQVIADLFKYSKNRIQEEHVLYEATSDDYFELLYPLEENFSNVFIVGHNPEISELINNFIDPKIDYLPTSGAVCIEFATKKWTEIHSAPFSVKFYISPRMLKSD